MTTANEVLKKLLKENVTSDVSDQYEERAKMRVVFEEVADEIVGEILGVHPQSYEGVTTKYYHGDSPPMLEITAHEYPVPSAEEFVEKFRSYADIPISVVIVEKTSEFISEDDANAVEDVQSN